MQTFQTLFKNQIIPNLGEVKVQELTPAMLDKWIRDIQKFSDNRKACLCLSAKKYRWSAHETTGE